MQLIALAVACLLLANAGVQGQSEPPCAASSIASSSSTSSGADAVAAATSKAFVDCQQCPCENAIAEAQAQAIATAVATAIVSVQLAAQGGGERASAAQREGSRIPIKKI